MQIFTSAGSAQELDGAMDSSVKGGWNDEDGYFIIENGEIVPQESGDFSVEEIDNSSNTIGLFTQHPPNGHHIARRGAIDSYSDYVQAETYYPNTYHYSRAQMGVRTLIWFDVRVDSGRVWGMTNTTARITGNNQLNSQSFWGTGS